MILNNTDQMLQFLSRSLGTGFFFHSFQDVQVKSICKIAEAVMECNQIPGGKLRKRFFAISLQIAQFLNKCH